MFQLPSDKTLRKLVLSIVLFLLSALVVETARLQPRPTKKPARPNVPRTWDESALASMEVPLARPAASPVYVSAEYYDRIPAMTIYKSYPIYAPGHEPPGYLDRLKRMEPEIVFDPRALKTNVDWIKAGELVFDAPIEYNVNFTEDEIRNPDWYARAGVPLAADGTMPFARYVIREKGKVEIGGLSCGTCHTRVMPDGSIIKGAQGNFPFDPSQAFTIRRRVTEKVVQGASRVLFGTPWLSPDPHARLERMSVEETASILEAVPPGVLARQGSSPFFPPKIPDLIGIKDHKYLDATGLVRHRSVGDLMRYAALNQGLDFTSRYGDFTPDDTPPEQQTRYTDEQLYALGLYLYSLKPPPNPNRFDKLAKRGQGVFNREGCVACHAPPLYTNNKLTPAEGFKVPEAHRRMFDVMPVSVGTDPQLTMKTRRGTGYYKVPSLKGVWYRGPFEHNGSVATLEDWFDPRRLGDDYVPTGFRGLGVKTRAVKGHPFGLNLSDDDREALIAFLKTL